MQIQTLRALVVLMALPVLAACGGSDDSDDPPRATHTVVGTITGFGSIVVNGIRFDDSTASISLDDASATRDRLRVGMVVQVRGRVDSAAGTGVATSIQVNDCVQGPITALDPAQRTVTVTGQTVQVDDDTVLDGVAQRELSGFAVGDQVEVSCLRDPANARLRATRMERLGTFQDGTSEVEVTGVVGQLDLVAGTCTVDGLPVNFSAVAAGGRPPGLANGMTVEASGRSVAGGILTADRLRDRDRDRINHPDGDGLEVEGFVSDFVSISDFEVAGQAVDAGNAVIRNGTAADIRNGLRVEAEGTVRNGVLVASVLVVKLQTSVRVEAGLQARDLATITLLGRAIAVNAETALIDRLGHANQPRTITLDALNPSDRLEVRAYREAGGALIATRVERTQADALVVVKGPADAKTPTSSLTLAGFAVATGADTRYRDASGTLVDATAFYGAVAVPPATPTMVHARGVVADLAANTVDATRSAGTIGELEIGVH